MVTKDKKKEKKQAKKHLKKPHKKPHNKHKKKVFELPKHSTARSHPFDGVRAITSSKHFQAARSVIPRVEGGSPIAEAVSKAGAVGRSMASWVSAKKKNVHAVPLTRDWHRDTGYEAKLFFGGLGNFLLTGGRAGQMMRQGAEIFDV